MSCVLLVAALATRALAQEDPSTPQPREPVEEVIVPGTRVENLRVEIERLERAVYSRWNELNSNDELDIQCLSSEPTGSNITQTQCVPNFVIQAESAAARNRLNSARNNSRRELDASLEDKRRQLTEEMQRVARGDEQFLRDLVRLDELRQQQASEREDRRSRR
jgi:hypothetical protein